MNATATQSPTEATSGKVREQSTIQFPYGDLDDAVSIARAVLACGGVPCEADQLAAAISQSPTSGNFRTKTATARIFGLVDFVQGKYQLTDLGFAVTDRTRERAARADAFLRVPLYRKVYEEFRNRPLPPRPAALERALVEFGVAQKQKERARQALDRSAQQAGFFDQGGRDRLIRPPVGSSGAPAPEESGEAALETPQDPEQKTGGTGGNDGGRRPPSGLHPFIQGLLAELPAPQTNWTVEGRAKWLQAAANIFDLMYKGNGEITVKANPKAAT